MLYRLHDRDITLGLAFIITFLPVYILFWIIKMEFILIVKLIILPFTIVHKLMKTVLQYVCD